VESELRETEVTYHKYRTALFILTYLTHQEPDWLSRQNAAWWKKWLLVLLRHQHWYMGERHEFWPNAFRIAHAVVPGRFVTALAEWLVIEPKEYLATDLFAADSLADDPAVQSALRGWVQSHVARSNEAFALAGLLLGHRDAMLETWLVDVVSQRNDITSDRCAPFAAAVLLHYRPTICAERIALEMVHDDAWARAILFRLRISGDISLIWFSDVSPNTLIRVWEMLQRLVPVDPWAEGGGTVTFEHDLSRLGGQLLNHLDSQHSPEAVAAVEQLLGRHPNRGDWLGRMLAKVRRAQRRESWHPLAPDVVARFLVGLTPRPISTRGDLCDAVLFSLGSYQSLLRGITRPTELWNEPTNTHPYYEPKDENVLSNCLANHLRRDLSGQGVVIAREEQTRRGTATEMSDHPDLMITATNPADPGKPLRLILEVKCAWNVQAITGFGDQLLARYLRSADDGIYLVAHFACPTWNSPKDPRKNRSLSRTPKPEVEAELRAELSRLRDTTDKRLEAFFLDAGL